MCLTENDTLLIWGLDLLLQPVIRWVFRHKLAGLKSLTNHRISSSELLFTSQRELLNHMGMFKKNSPCDVECVYLALLSSGLHVFYVMLFMLRKKMQRHWLLVDILLMIAGEFITEYVKHAESNSPGLILLVQLLYVLIWGCSSIKGSILVLSDQRIVFPFAAFVAGGGTLSGLVGFSDGRPCGTLPSLHSQWPLGSRSRLLLKLFSKLFRFFSTPESLGWIPENLELSRDVLSSAVRPSTGCCVPTLYWIQHRWTRITSKTCQEKVEYAQSSILGVKKAWKHPPVEYFALFFQ